ncbi:hemolysin family protein [Loigolactobacillus iwatensis]|uniref:hemolysin family protein n=1 Tax=Loigolactobacillus iwatensis TaxID=1267156 RepID=UPI000F7DD317|nr:hemolysin family protein [Loigolactobacillus iwatensis]
MSSDPGSHIWVQLVLALVLIGLRGFLTAVMIAINTISKAQAQRLVDAGKRKAKRLLKVVNQVTAVSATLELLIVFIDISIGVLGLLVGVRLWPDFTNETLLGFLIAVFMSIILFSFTSVLPRKFGQARAQSLALMAASFVNLLTQLFRPLLWLLAKLGPSGASVERPELTREDMVDMIESGQKSGVIESDEFEMFEGIIEMRRKMAREVMVPRTDAFMINIDDTNQQNITAILNQNYSRIPVYKGDKDKVVGIVHIKNIMQRAHEIGFENVQLTEVMQEALYVPETIMIDDLLYEMKKSQNQMGILLDEYGGLVGLVTIEDLLEEIVGEIDDETDEAEVPYRQIDERHYTVKGSMPLDDFNDLFTTDLDNPDVDTIAGYVLTGLGTIPEEGQQLTMTLPNNIKLTTGEMDGSRLLDIRVELPAAVTASSADEND